MRLSEKQKIELLEIAEGEVSCTIGSGIDDSETEKMYLKCRNYLNFLIDKSYKKLQKNTKK